MFSRTQQIEDILELQVSRLVKTCAIFVSALFSIYCDYFLKVVFVFLILLEQATSKYAIILHIFGTFFDMLRIKVPEASREVLEPKLLWAYNMGVALSLLTSAGNLNRSNIFREKNYYIYCK